MSIWDTLGIEPTTDKRTIKRAYAKLAAKYHPEEQPEKFQAVYDAYEQALAYAGEVSTSEIQFSEQMSIDSAAKQNKETDWMDTVDFSRFSSDRPERNPDLRTEKEKATIDFEKTLTHETIPKLILKSDDETYQIDFEHLVSNYEKKLTLKQEPEKTIDFSSIQKEQFDYNEPFRDAGLQDNSTDTTKTNRGMGMLIRILVCVFVFGLIQLFSGELDFANIWDTDFAGEKRVERMLERKYDTDFTVAPIETPTNTMEVYYLIAKGKSKEEYQWFQCSTVDAEVPVTFYVSLNSSNEILYDYAYKQLFAFIDNAGLGGFLDSAEIQKNNLKYYKNGELRYCYPVLKAASGNVNTDYFQRLGTLIHLIQNSDVQYANRNHLIINLKNSGNGGIYHLKLEKGKKVDMEEIKQGVLAFYGK